MTPGSQLASDRARQRLERALKIALSDTRVIVSQAAVSRLAERLAELLELEAGRSDTP